MSDPIRELYESRGYPAMSHPSTDPALTAVSAKLAGLSTAPPAGSRVLEIGCSSGHNLLHLAARWPDARFTGIDLSAPAIHEAQATAGKARLANIRFLQADLTAFDPGDESYDFIIAHGVYSWVPPEVRSALLEFCARHLATDGIATLSFNTLPGWALRKPLVELTNLLLTRPAADTMGHAPENILSYLAASIKGDTPYGGHLMASLNDMLAKGPELLPFDDFGPFCEPSTFLDFVALSVGHGLRYLGESQIPENLPSSLTAETLEALKPLERDPLMLQQTIDVLTGRTFRSALLCRADAPVQARVTTASLLQLSARTTHTGERSGDALRLFDPSGREAVTLTQPLAVAFFEALLAAAPECPTVRELMEAMAAKSGVDPGSETGLPALAGLVFDSARKGLIELRIEPVRFGTGIPARPQLSPLNLLAAERNQPLVDRYLSPCTFRESHQPVLACLDGTRDLEALRVIAGENRPKLDLEVWLSHLARRGLL